MNNTSKFIVFSISFLFLISLVQATITLDSFGYSQNEDIIIGNLSINDTVSYGNLTNVALTNQSNTFSGNITASWFLGLLNWSNIINFVNPFNQAVNTTSNVTFNTLTINGYKIYAPISNDLVNQSTAVTSIVNTTSPNDAANHTYSIGGYITVTAISINTITLQVTYIDETNTTRTQSFFGEGLTTAAVSTTGGFTFPPMTIRAANNTLINLKTTVVGVGTESYDVGGYLQEIN